MTFRVVSALLILIAGLVTAALAAAQEAVPVSVAKAAKVPVVEEVPLTGSVTAPRTAVLSAAVGGLVNELHVDIGHRVEVGDTLLQLETDLARADVAAARAELHAAEAELDDAQRRVDEARPLAEQNNIAATEMRARENQLKIAQAAVERTRAQLTRQQRELARHTVSAPFNGVVSRKLTELGEWVAPGREVLELVATDNLLLDFRVPQHYYPRIDERANVAVKFDALPERTYPGEIITTVPVSSPDARTFLLRARLTDNSPAITPGMSTHGVLRLHTQREGVMVPRDAVIRYADGRTVVWVIDDSGDKPRVSERVVNLGLSNAGRVEIRRGLEAGTRVVTRGNEALQPDQPVTIVEQADAE